MIIVKTKNGDSFINDKAVTMVAHDREKAVVNAHGDNGLFFHIEDVEGIIYANDAQAIAWKDEGSEIERLQKKLDEQLEWGRKIRKEYMDMQKKNNQLEEEVKNLMGLVKTLEEMKPTSAPKQKIILRATSPIGSDCTQAYDVDGCDGMTVKDFILTVIKNDPHVAIDLKRGDKYIWNGEYNNQALRKERFKELSEDMLLLKIKSARAAGGWGQMSYNVKLY
jgi:hypothetical protein